MLKKILFFLFSLAATVSLIWFADRPVPLGEVSLPPLGRLLNPFSGFWRNAEPAKVMSGLSENFDLPGLKAPVEVVYDDLKIPHIFAQNMADAMMVQGFVTARDRLWQMDLVSRSASGRLSEVMGKRTVEFDRLTRRQGMVWAAENNLESWKKSPETIEHLDAYSAGVNAYISQLSIAQRPIEFKLLNYEPELWTTLKTSLVVESMARNLCGYSDDGDATAMRDVLGEREFQSLFPQWNPKNQPIVPDFGQWKSWKTGNETENTTENPSPKVKKLPAVSEKPGNLSNDFPKFGNDFSFENKTPSPFRAFDGSNNWAISGKKSASGHAFLANDPHLSLTLPSIWFAVQIHTPEVNCFGVSLPGVPGIVIGFNENFAWGVTNGSEDVLDWYKISWANADRTAYNLDGKTKNVRLKLETIKIKYQPDLLDTVRYTDWGPVTYDFQLGHPLADCSMFWISHLAPDQSQMMSLYKLNTAKTVAEGQKDIDSWDTPAQNFVMADREGNIGIQVQGRFPLRKNEAGRFIQDGSKSENAWPGFIPADRVPKYNNPGRGFVFSANQHPVPPSFPYKFLGSFDDARNRRIFNRLAAMDSATVDSMKSIQLDNFNSLAADALPVMLKLTDTAQLDGAEKKLWDELHGWNFKFEKEMTLPSVFEMWSDSCYHLTFDEMYALDAADKPALFPDFWRWIDLMQHDPKNRFFDIQNTPEKETAREVVTQSFKKLTPEIAKSLLGGLEWGKYKHFKINHLARIDAFSRTDIQTSGHRNAPNAISSNHGPSWRMIVELGDTVRAVGVYPGGQSGNPGSPFYDNLVAPWAEGKYFDLQLLRNPGELKFPLQKSTFSPGKK